MKFSNYSVFSSDIKKFGTERAAEHTKALGFETVEFLTTYAGRDTAKIKTVEDAREAGRILDAYGLPVSCYSVGADIYSVDKVKMFAFFKKQIEMAAELGSPYFHHTVIPWLSLTSESPSYDYAFKNVIDIVEKIAKYANSLSMTALYEPQGMYFNTAAGLDGIYSELKSRGCNVGICYDLGNPLFADTMPEDIGEYFSETVKHIHIKDYIYTETEIPEMTGYITKGGRYLYDILPGKGIVNFSKCLDTLKNYKGDVSFEFLGNDEEIKESISYIRKFV